MSVSLKTYVTYEQSVLFTKTFGCCRFVYNRMLADKTLHYDSIKESLYNACAKQNRV
ncbi:MAG: helix-turn-helix domain-containing protein [Christensenellaceae bacterium]|nr:helix-turn-helix domain-containing protein [Christensenellaceae bacterium]